jgi:hypothetical protein
MPTFQQLPKKYRFKSIFVPMHVTEATKGKGGGETAPHILKFGKRYISELSPSRPVRFIDCEGVAGADLT